MLLASALRSVRASWLGVGPLALILAVGAAPAGLAQSGTVYIGGGGNSADGARGVQGRDNVIVNMDAIDGGRGRGRNARGRGAGGDRQTVEPGEPYQSPAGALLRFPPKRPPQSQLTVDPSQLSGERQARRDTGQDQAASASGRGRQQPGQAAATPGKKPDASRSTRRSGTTQSVEVPDAPSFEPGGSPDAESGAGEPDRPDADRPNADGQTGADGTAPTELAARPSRKPQPPQDSQGARQSDAAAGATADPAGPETDDATAPSGDRAGGGAAAGSAETGDPSSRTQTSQADTSETGTSQTGTGGSDPATTEPAAQPSGTSDGSGSDDSGSGDSGSDGSGSDGSGSGDSGSSDPGETQTASLPPEGLPDQMRLTFDDGSASLSDGAKRELDQLARVLTDSPGQRVQLMAFAEGTEDTASEARRLSLSRALAVRTYLIDQGIRSTRMDVRALGATAERGPLNRVDIVPANR